MISKILATRLKPFIAGCISENQCAFVPGREISANVILLREILHSFKASSYKSWDFCLKLDLSKAFDRMNWSYIQSLLPLYGFPEKLCNWIMICVKSAEFSIVVNGRGDGFLKPKSGLRQGCALSPYLFILGMDLLSRGLSHLTNLGHLRGIKLAHSAPSITNSLYADDLLLFGKAQPQEATALMAAINSFSEMSGQRVGIEKSEVWFSRCTPIPVREEVSQLLGVHQQQMSGKYLGAPLATSVGAFNFLIDKFMHKLQAWKGRKMSPAGRLVMIKSALQSVPLYYFGTVKLPQGVLQKLTSIIRCFFWGKQVGERYLAYVAWDAITAPIELGGLGIRDLNCMNEAMLMKALWRITEKEETLWVKVVKAKYMPRSDLWTSKRTYNCTVFWRNLMALRPKLLPLISWKIGDGELCRVYGQPWFPGALQYEGQAVEDRRLVVRNLGDHELGGWDVEQLVRRFGYQNSVHIISNLQPPNNQGGEDVLLFNPSANGRFSVKKMYNELNCSWRQAPASIEGLWRKIWKFGNIQPRVRLFIWKLVKNALPLAKTISYRIASLSPICALCSQENEDGVHMGFKCAFARACWASSLLPLRTEQLPQSMSQVVAEVLEWATAEQWTTFAMVLWGIWRCRNLKVYQNTQPSLQQFSLFFNQIREETLTVQVAKGGNGRGTGIGGIPIPTDALCCYTDASWDNSWETGLVFALVKGDTMLAYGVNHCSSSCPIQAEAKALLEAVRYVVRNGYAGCCFCTDNKVLADAVSQFNPPTAVDWRATREMVCIWEILKANINFKCVHVARCHNVLADYLAGLGRRDRMEYLGFTYPLFKL